MLCVLYGCEDILTSEFESAPSCKAFGNLPAPAPGNRTRARSSATSPLPSYLVIWDNVVDAQVEIASTLARAAAASGSEPPVNELHEDMPVRDTAHWLRHRYDRVAKIHHGALAVTGSSNLELWHRKHTPQLTLVVFLAFQLESL